MYKCVFSVTNEVVVVVILVLVEDIWTIITDISYSITILVCLVRIVHSRTVVFCVGDEIIVNIWIAHISQLIPICVLLFGVAGDEIDLEESEKNLLYLILLQLSHAFPAPSLSLSFCEKQSLATF